MSEVEQKFSFKRSYRIKFLFILTTIVLIVLMFPKGESLEFEVTVGSIWLQDDLIASKAFPLLKSEQQYENELKLAEEKVNEIFEKDIELVKLQKRKFMEFKKNINNILANSYFETSTHDTIIFSKETISTLKLILQSEDSFVFEFDKTIKEILSVSDYLLNKIYKKGILNKEFENIKKDEIDIRIGKYQRSQRKNKYFTPNSAKIFIENYLQENFSNNPKINLAVKEITVKFLKPNYILNEYQTNLAKSEAKNKVSRNLGIVNENERIIAKHDRVTQEAKLKIDSYRAAKSLEMGFSGKVLQTIGKFLHIILILSIFSIYIFLFRKNILNNNYKILLILIIFLLLSFIAFLIQQLNVNTPVEYLIVIPVASMLLTIIFDSRIGFYGTIVIALIIGGLRGNDYVFVVTNIIAGAFAAYTVRDIKNRNQIFRSFFYILLGYLLSILAFGLERFATLDSILYTSIFAFSGALISPVLTFGLIIFFERIFNITTELTYLELTDFNHPLLKELARNAPGTFNHSMTIGSMVETACEVINANPLLARVGAYYHDIGKSVDPLTFVENQMSNDNLHENIYPDRSSELIISHVLKGIELAEKYRLPKEVANFIPMHHGTMVVKYFYEKAKEVFGEDKISIDDYRYPGPKPNSKETALVMLADACESAVRSMIEPDAKKIENMINNLIQQRIDDNQLDESPLTFEDIKKIKVSFLNILIGQHHKRIRYPKQDEMENQTNVSESL